MAEHHSKQPSANDLPAESADTAPPDFLNGLEDLLDFASTEAELQRLEAAQQAFEGSAVSPAEEVPSEQADPLSVAPPPQPEEFATQAATDQDAAAPWQTEEPVAAPVPVVVESNPPIELYEAKAVPVPSPLAEFAAAAIVDLPLAPAPAQTAQATATLQQWLAATSQEVSAKAVPAPTSSSNGEGEEKHLFFDLAGTHYTLPLGQVLEIGDWPAITFVPNLPEWVLGVANLRGDVISVVDLRRFLGLECAAQSARSRTVVVRSRHSDLVTGLLVDRVHGIRALSGKQLTGLAPQDGTAGAQYVRGATERDNELIVTLDLDRMLASSEMLQFADA